MSLSEDEPILSEAQYEILEQKDILIPDRKEFEEEDEQCSMKLSSDSKCKEADSMSVSSAAELALSHAKSANFNPKSNSFISDEENTAKSFTFRCDRK
jgi:hypothetical protein